MRQYNRMIGRSFSDRRKFEPVVGSVRVRFRGYRLRAGDHAKVVRFGSRIVRLVGIRHFDDRLGARRGNRAVIVSDAVHEYRQIIPDVVPDGPIHGVGRAVNDLHRVGRQAAIPLIGRRRIRGIQNRVDVGVIGGRLRGERHGNELRDDRRGRRCRHAPFGTVNSARRNSQIIPDVVRSRGIGTPVGADDRRLGETVARSAVPLIRGFRVRL